MVIERDRMPGERTPNRLAAETSPYLLQHALNPVDWYPWCDEAFQVARDRDCPVFLSVGYSACHWCHVMERESFEHAEIAAFLNQHFVSVKVDREERPDVDQIYMHAVVALTGGGGWPMSVFLDHDAQPFFGGTYWPPENRYGRPGFLHVLQSVAAAWKDRRDELGQGAEELTRAAIRLGSPQQAPVPLTSTPLKAAGKALLRSWDRQQGGFGTAPKFPHPMNLRLLLRLGRREPDEGYHAAALHSLQCMQRGGFYDLLGGGFHRYSTDAAWLVPHFEKMLYDNALLVQAYLDAWQVTGSDEFRTTAQHTLQYVVREMTRPEGGFCSSQDADSEGEEGQFFVWSADEIEQCLGPENFKQFALCYGVSERGHWEGRNILHRTDAWDGLADRIGCGADELQLRMSDCCRQLFEVRSQRPAPDRDDKRLAAWNGMMIAAMARGARLFNDSTFHETAVEAFQFIAQAMIDSDARVAHSYQDGQARFRGLLDDYACLIDAAIELYLLTADGDYLASGLRLAESMIDHFGDLDGDGFFYTPHDHERLIARNKDCQDNATPSGNAMAASVLFKLARLAGREELLEQVHSALRLLSGFQQQSPLAAGHSLAALDDWLGPSYEIVVAGGKADERRRWLRALNACYLPRSLVLEAGAGSTERVESTEQTETTETQTVSPLVKDKGGAEVRMFVCSRGTCQAPIESLAAALRCVETLELQSWSSSP